MKNTQSWFELLEKAMSWLKRQTERFIKLHFVFKIILFPIVYSLFFLLVFPFVIVFGMGYKIYAALKGLSQWLFKNWQLLMTFMKYLLFQLPILFIVLIFMFFLVTIYIHFTLPMFSDVVLKILGCIALPYLIFVQIMFSNSSSEKLKSKIDEDADLKAFEYNSRTPIFRLLRKPFVLSLVSSLNLIGTIFLVIIGLATMNAAFPSVFFKAGHIVPSTLAFWLKYMIDQLLIIIPIDLAGPFLPNKTSVFIVQPWGGVLSIFVQLLLTYMIFLSIRGSLLAAKIRIELKKRQ